MQSERLKTFILEFRQETSLQIQSLSLQLPNKLGRIIRHRSPDSYDSENMLTTIDVTFKFHWTFDAAHYNWRKPITKYNLNATKHLFWPKIHQLQPQPTSAQEKNWSDICPGQAT